MPGGGLVLVARRPRLAPARIRPSRAARVRRPPAACFAGQLRLVAALRRRRCGSTTSGRRSRARPRSGATPSRRIATDSTTSWRARADRLRRRLRVPLVLARQLVHRAQELVGRRLVRRHPARAVRSNQDDARLRAARQAGPSARAPPRAPRRPRVLAHQRVAADRAELREHRRDVGGEVAASLAVARVARAARAAARFDLVAAVADEALAAGRAFARVRGERDLDGRDRRARGAAAGAAASIPEMATRVHTIQDESRRFPPRWFGVIFPRCRAPTGLPLLLLTARWRRSSRAGARRRPSRPQAAPATAAALPSPKLDVKNWTLRQRPQGAVPRRSQGADRDGAGLLSRRIQGRARRHPRRRAHVRAHDVQGLGARPARGARAPAQGGRRPGQRLHDRGPDRVPRHRAAVVRRLRAGARGRAHAPAQAVSSRRSTPSASVVEEEKRLRIDNDPIGKAIEKFRALAYVKHPYNWTPIGTIEDLEKVTPADCQRFYDTYYQPNNATLIVVGDVDEADGAQAGRAALRADPARPRAAARRRRGAAADGDARRDAAHRGADPGRRRRLPHPARRRSRRPGAGGAGGGAVGRRVVAPAPAPGAPASTWRSRPAASPRRSSIRGCSSSTPRTCPIATPAAVQAVLAEEIARVRDKPITADELDKAKNQLAAGFVFGLQTVDGVAQALGRAQYVEGDWKRFVEGATRYLAVTAADVQRVAQKYLVDTNLTRVTLAQPRRRRPRHRRRRETRNEAPPRARCVLLARRRLRRVRRRARAKPPASAGDRRASSTTNAGAPRRRPSPNADYWAGPHGSHPGARAAQAGRAGAAAGPALHAQERPGGDRGRRARTCRSSASASPCRRAATTRAATRWASPTSSRRCSAAAPRPAAPTTSRTRSTSSAARWTRRRPTRARPRAARRCRRTPSCASTCCRTSCCTRRSRRARWARCATRCWPRVAARFDNPHELANAHFDNLLFGEKHPDGWVLTAEDVRKITRARLETFWKTFYRPNRAILAVAGDVDAAQAARRHREGVRRLGARRRSRRARPGRSRKLDGDAHPARRPPRSRRRRRSCSATRASSTPIRAGTRRR